MKRLILIFLKRLQKKEDQKKSLVKTKKLIKIFLKKGKIKIFGKQVTKDF